MSPSTLALCRVKMGDMDKEQVLSLAKLARIKISDGEAENLSHEFDGILRYVGEVRSLKQEPDLREKDEFPIRNVMREDVENNEPKKSMGYIKVKKIL